MVALACAHSHQFRIKTQIIAENVIAREAAKAGKLGRARQGTASKDGSVIGSPPDRLYNYGPAAWDFNDPRLSSSHVLKLRRPPVTAGPLCFCRGSMPGGGDQLFRNLAIIPATVSGRSSGAICDALSTISTRAFLIPRLKSSA